MKQLSALIFTILLSAVVTAQQDTNSSKITPPFSFEQLQRTYDTLIPIFDGLFITHNQHDKNAPVHIPEIGPGLKPSGETHKWGVVDSSGNIIVPFICDGVKAIDGHQGIASVYVFSFSLNTGIPRYRYNGKYFFFSKNGRTKEKEKEFSITVVAVSDWHFEKFVVQKGPGFYLPQEYRDLKNPHY